MGVGRKMANGLVWTFAESLSSKAVAFVVTLVLARLLLPEQYGIVSIVTIIIALLNVFVISGLGSALIQKKECDNLDYSTILWFSLAVALVFYLILFASANYVAHFFKIEELTGVLRVMGLQLFLSSVISVQSAYVAKRLWFKKSFFASLISTILSGLIGIFLAYAGFGVWALVAQSLLCSLFSIILLCFISPLQIFFRFSIERFLSLFSFGWKLLCSSLLDTLYDEVVGLAIGKKYSASDLAFYDKGKQLPTTVSTVVTTSLSKALYPSLSLIQDDRQSVKGFAKRSLKTIAMALFPLLVFLIVVAKPLIVVLFTERWSGAIIYLQILSLFFLLKPFQAINLNIFKALGYGDVVLKNNLYRKLLGITIVIFMVMITNSPIFIAIAVLFTGIIDTIINAFPNKKLVNYGLMAYSIFVGVIMFVLGLLIHTLLLTLLVQLCVGCILYWCILKITHNSVLRDATDIIKTLILHKH